MADWYDEGYDALISDMADTIEEMVKAGASFREIAEVTYGTLSEDGFIDYDVEKDIFYEWFGPEEANDNDD